MSTDIEDLLTSILDDSQPLPVEPPPRQPTPAQVTVGVARNSGNTKAEADLAMSDPETWLESLMKDQPPNITKEEFNKIEDAHVEKTLSHSSVKVPVMAPAGIPSASDDDILAGILDGNTDAPGQAIQVPAGGEVATPQASGATGVFTDTDERTSPQFRPLTMPTFTAADFAETMDIRNFATLVTLNTARWHAKVKDRKANHDIAAANDATAEAFETRKHLLGGANDLLKAIHRAIDEARAAHYELTLPWSTTSLNDTGRRVGGRLLPNTLFVEYTTVMATKKAAMKAALDAFLPEYPKIVEEAKKKLGKRFDAREYPNVSSITQHFDLSFDFQPIPKGDDFKGLPQVQLDALASKVNDNTRIMAENAMQDVWCRMYEAVARMAERLSSPDKMFHSSLVQNVQDAARLAAHLNVSGDARVDAIRKKIEKYLCGHEPKDLREKSTLRAEVAGHAASIMQEMNK